jgi:hypothetical protein
VLDRGGTLEANPRTATGSMARTAERTSGAVVSAIAMIRRKAIYEELRPETKAGAATSP